MIRVVNLTVWVALIVAGMAAAIVVALLAGGAKPAQAGAFPGKNGHIAFDSAPNFTNDYEIYSMNPDGSLQTNLSHSVRDIQPSYSANGKKIAFQSQRDGNYEIYIMNANGTGAKRLTTDPAEDRTPAWSPDGTHIAFDRLLSTGHYQVFVMNSDGTHQRRLTSLGDNYTPSWSPSGKKIVFSSNRDGNVEIYNMNSSDGTNQTDLTNAPGATDDDPAYSPDGKKIAFRSFRDGNNSEIYKMSSDGTNQTNLTNDPASYDDRPSWQPLH